ncbi:MAG TPA: hypothetical protein VGA93_03370 [Actinomycetota bacterium]
MPTADAQTRIVASVLTVCATDEVSIGPMTSRLQIVASRIAAIGM